MLNMNKAPIAAVALGTGLLLAGCGDHKTPAPTPSPSQSGGLPTAEQYCDVTPYPLSDYAKKVGDKLLSPMTFGADADSTRAAVAEAIAPDTAAIAVTATILSAEKSFVPQQIGDASTGLFEQLAANSDLRNKACQIVINRVLTAPLLRDWQSSTGVTSVFSPAYTGGNLTGINSVSTPNNDHFIAFGIAPVAGSDDVARDTAISQNWGIRADGTEFRTADTTGNTESSITGTPVEVKPTGAPEAPSPVASPAPEAGVSTGASTTGTEQTNGGTSTTGTNTSETTSAANTGQNPVTSSTETTTRTTTGGTSTTGTAPRSAAPTSGGAGHSTGGSRPTNGSGSSPTGGARPTRGGGSTSTPTSIPTGLKPDAGPTTPGVGPTTPNSGPTTPNAGPTTPNAGPTTPNAGPTTPAVPTGPAPTTPGHSPNPPATPTQPANPSPTPSTPDSSKAAASCDPNIARC